MFYAQHRDLSSHGTSHGSNMSGDATSTTFWGRSSLAVRVPFDTWGCQERISSTYVG